MCYDVCGGGGKRVADLYIRCVDSYARVRGGTNLWSYSTPPSIPLLVFDRKVCMSCGRGSKRTCGPPLKLFHVSCLRCHLHHCCLSVCVDFVYTVKAVEPVSIVVQTVLKFHEFSFVGRWRPEK